MNTRPPYHKPTAENRNKPCPCGSGSKLKKCCGSAANANAYNEWHIEQQKLAMQKKREEREVEEKAYEEKHGRRKPMDQLQAAIMIGSLMALSHHRKF